ATNVRPLVFEFGLVQEQCGLSFRIIKDDTLGILVQRATKECDWENFYSFTEDPALPIDYYYAHYWCTTHPESVFNKNTIVHLPTQYGRNTIGDIYDPITSLKVREFRSTMPDGSVARFVPRTPERYAEALKEFFGIVE
ncbi:MAG: arylamine N-acetyltransferase, partial [Eubacteriales bacterium]